MERRIKEESVLLGNFSKIFLFVIDVYVKNYVSFSLFLKDLNDIIENVLVGLDQSNLNSFENVLNELVFYNIMFFQFEFVKLNLKWNVLNNGESFIGKYIFVKELISNCIGSILSNLFSVVSEGISFRRIIYIVKR